MSFIGKSYKLASSDNFDGYMKALGIGLVARKAGAAISPVVSLKQDGDQYILATSFTFKNYEIKFKLGEEFDEERFDGAEVKSVINLDGNTLTQVQKSEDGKTSTIVREFANDEMKAVMSIGDVVSTRVYKAQ